MSKVSISGNDSGNGTFTIAAPNSNNNRTFSLPDEAGTALTDASDLEPQVKSSLNATGDAPLFACRAWINFNGTGTVSIRDSGNVSSISDNGTGNYTVNFTTAMPDVNYAALTAAKEGNDNNNISVAGIDYDNASASSFKVFHNSDDTGAFNPTYLGVAVFR